MICPYTPRGTTSGNLLVRDKRCSSSPHLTFSAPSMRRRHGCAGTGITKRYPAVVANSGEPTVQPGDPRCWRKRRGQVHADEDHLRRGQARRRERHWNGQPCRSATWQEARAWHCHGVPALQPVRHALTVAENVWAGLDKSQTLAEVTSASPPRPPNTASTSTLRPVHTLSVGEMQRVEIIRAPLTNPALLILTSPLALTPPGGEKFLWCCANWRARAAASSTSATSCIEIRALCTVCTVLGAARSPGVTLRKKPTPPCRA